MRESELQNEAIAIGVATNSLNCVSGSSDSRAKLISNETQTLTKKCAKCFVIKSVTEFYTCNSKLEDEQRWENQCKECKKTLRNAKYKAAREPERVIEPALVSQPEPQRAIEPPKSVAKHTNNEPDFSLWERLYVRKLTDDERREIKTNLTAFFKVLIKESERLRGLGIEVLKDK